MFTNNALLYSLPKENVMTMKRDMAYYIDGNELVSPERVPFDLKRASDNGVLHSSRYLILQKLNRESIDEECLNGVKACIDSDGYLHRAPDDPSENVPDDHYGIISLFSVLNIHTSIKLPWKCLHPMLVYMRALQRGGLESLIARILSLPMAILIALSNQGDSGETSNRLLTWNIIQGTKKSLLCRIGAAIWVSRQNSLYKTPNSIKLIAGVYYSQNPLPKYWLT